CQGQDAQVHQSYGLWLQLSSSCQGVQGPDGQPNPESLPQTEANRLTSFMPVMPQHLADVGSEEAGLEEEGVVALVGVDRDPHHRDAGALQELDELRLLLGGER